jgi:site-specific DNA recombinase
VSRFQRATRASAVAVATAPVRVGIYARVSTDERLGQAFNSIHHQREACESYVNAHRGEGWSGVAEDYSDGGFTGANTTRPALQRLIADVEAGKIDVVLTYKLDRLSRSMRDFLNLLHFFDEHNVSFVSVSQSFDTTTPIGKMTLNLLASFGEFERQVTAARTKDKLGAARRRGKYVGGYLVLGYDRAPEGGHLVVNGDEAEMVREIFRLFLANRSLVATLGELDRRKWTSKKWKTRDGKDFGGGRFDAHKLRRLLGHHIYEGRVLFEGTLYDGEHAAIISPKVFREVQQVLDAGRRDTRPGAANKYGCLLRGLLFCGCGSPMVHTPTTRGSRIFRYYRCAATMRRGAATCSTRLVRAALIEDSVVAQVRRIGTDTRLQHETFQQAVAQIATERRAARVEARRLKREVAAGKRDLVRLVDTLTRTTGSAASAVQEQLAVAQERLAAIEARLAEVLTTVESLAAQQVDEADVARALQDFEGLWSVLVLAEKERLLHLLISAVRYDGANGALEIDWRLAGFGQLAAEISGA